jgi:TetR/AcrR family transcriptional regulator, regulator of autoinduction and epiphytic fitness
VKWQGTSKIPPRHEVGGGEKTVYLAFPTKLELLKEVVDVALVGDDRPVPVAARDWWRELEAEPDLGRKLELLAAGSLNLHRRTAEVFEVARGAAAAGPQAAELWRAGKRSLREDCERLAGNLLANPALPLGITRDNLIVTLFAILSPETYRQVVADLGRTPDQYRDWLLGSLRRLLLARA